MINHYPADLPLVKFTIGDSGWLDPYPYSWYPSLIIIVDDDPLSLPIEDSYIDILIFLCIKVGISPPHSETFGKHQ